jgi:hypothetical protein
VAEVVDRDGYALEVEQRLLQFGGFTGDRSQEERGRAEREQHDCRRENPHPRHGGTLTPPVDSALANGFERSGERDLVVQQRVEVEEIVVRDRLAGVTLVQLRGQ